MNRAAAFALVAAGAAVGAVSGAMAVNKKGRSRIKQQPYAAIGSGLLATGVAAVVYAAPTCPVCPSGTSTPVAISRGGYAAAVAASAIVGGIAGAMAVGKNRSARLAQQVYAPIGAAFLGAGAAAVFLPDPTSCTPCPTLPPAPAPTPKMSPVPADQSPPPR